VCFVEPPQPAAAQRIQSIYAAQVQEGNAPTLTVHPGYGLNLFLKTGEKITKAWLDDPTQIALDFDKRPPAATLVHLRNISGLSFPGLRRAPNRTTLLSILTDAGTLYQFQLKPSEGLPRYTTMAIQNGGYQSQMVDISATQRGSLEDVERGLQIAQARKLLVANGAMASKVMSFTALVRNGKTIPSAASEAGVSLSVITKLAEMGQRPQKSLSPPTEAERRTDAF
jgi:hypothetical protein